MKKISIFILLMALVLTFITIGCGSGGGGSAESPTGPTSSPSPDISPSPTSTPSIDIDKMGDWLIIYSGGPYSDPQNQYLGRTYKIGNFEDDHWTVLVTGYSGNDSGRCCLVLKTIEGKMCFGEGIIDLNDWSFAGLLKDIEGNIGAFNGVITQDGVKCKWELGISSGEFETFPVPGISPHYERRGIYIGQFTGQDRGDAECILGSDGTILGVIYFDNIGLCCLRGSENLSGEIASVLYGDDLEAVALGERYYDGFRGVWGIPVASGDSR